MHLCPFSGEGMSQAHCPYGVSALMCLKGFGVQQEDPCTVHLLKTPDAAMRVLFLVLCYIEGLGELGKRSDSETCRTKGIQKCYSWNTRVLISEGQDIREST